MASSLFLSCRSSRFPLPRPSISLIRASSHHPLNSPPARNPSPDHSLLRTKMYTSTQHEDAWTRVCSSAVEYAAMALAGEAICHFAGIDNVGGFQVSSDVLVRGLGFAVFPVLALSIILDDQIVQKSAAARAIRESEDEQTIDHFAGMYPWQLMLIVTMDVMAEELFFRMAIQGGLVHAFLSHACTTSSVGVAALAGNLPFVAPFAHVVAAVLTSGIVGSTLLVSQGPSYLVAQAHGFSSRKELKEIIGEWKEQQQLKRVYSSLLDSLLALYLGLEWVQTQNILAPMITHFIYSSFIVNNSLGRHKSILRQGQRTLLHDASDM